MDPEASLKEAAKIVRDIIGANLKGSIPSKHLCNRLGDLLQAYADWREKLGFEPEFGDVGGDVLHIMLKGFYDRIPDAWLGV